MNKDLPDYPVDTDDDAPVKVAYHKAPGSEETAEQEEENTSDSVIASETKQSSTENEQIAASSDSVETPRNDTDDELEEEKDPLDDDEGDPLDDEEEPEEPEIEETEEEEKPTGTLYQNIRVAEPVSSNGLNVYYFQTVKAGEQPEWQVPKEELDIFSKPLDDGMMQYWAYPKSLGKTEDSVPNAEIVAIKNKSANPVIIIDQLQDHLDPGCCLELILAKNGHALAKTDSNLDNLEANITSLIDSAKMNYGVTVEHFISTSNVSAEVEKRLDDLEDAGGERENPDTELDQSDLKQASVYQPEPSIPPPAPTGAPTGGKSKMGIIIIAIILIVLGVVLIFFRDNVFSIINPPAQKVEITPTPTETPTPTPTIAVERSKYKVRILNGTPKSGAAGVLAEKLKALGWMIDKTGNATSSAVNQSYVRGKVEIDEVIKALISDVSDYEATSSAVILKPTDKADLEFVIGKK